MTPKRVLHCHSTFSPGGKELRTATLMNAFGELADHVIWTAQGTSRDAADAIAPHISVRFAEEAPPLNGRPRLGRYRAIARYLQGFDLVLTYNWGAMDVVAARRLFPQGCPPLIHHEDGFNEDEAVRLNRWRSLFRRWALAAASHIIVPSHGLAHIAQRHWGQGGHRVSHVSNGVALDRFTPRTAPRETGVMKIGAVGGLRRVKNFGRLIRAFVHLPANARLVILGEGPERTELEALAHSLGVADRVSLPGHVADIAAAICDFDIFALSSDTEQAPISVIEAMAAALPIVATDVGDIRTMVSPENQPFTVPLGDEARFAEALSHVAGDADLRARLGRANRARAQAGHDIGQMIGRYAQIYGLADPRASELR